MRACVCVRARVLYQSHFMTFLCVLSSSLRFLQENTKCDPFLVINIFIDIFTCALTIYKPHLKAVLVFTMKVLLAGYNTVITIYRYLSFCRKCLCKGASFSCSVIWCDPEQISLRKMLVTCASMNAQPIRLVSELCFHILNFKFQLNCPLKVFALKHP